MDEARRVATTLVNAIQRLQEEQTHQPERHTTALHKLAAIFRDTTGQLARVDIHPTQTSTTPTAPVALRTAPRTHQRVTRNNQPRILPPLVAPPTPPAPSAGVSVPTTEGVPQPRRSPRLPSNLHVISQETINHAFNMDTQTSRETDKSHPTIDIEHFCSPVIHPITGETIHTYQKLAKDPATREIWTTAFGKEFGNLAQGDDKTKTEGTNSIFVLALHEIPNIPKDRTVTYARIVVDHCPQKPDPN